MKTIITTLPIYDKITKQCYERSKHSGNGIVPIICPRHRLPSFMWKDDGDGATSISSIELVSEEFRLSDAETIFTSWASHSFDTSYTNSGIYFHGVNAGVGVWGVVSTPFDVEIGDEIRIYGFVSGAAGGYPYAFLNSNPHDLNARTGGASLLNGVIDVTLFATVAGTTQITIAGVGAINVNITTMTITKTKNIKNITSYFPTLPALGGGYFVYNGDTLNILLDFGVYYLKITTNNGKIYYSEYFRVDCVFGDDGLPPAALYSEKYLIIEFFNSCNLGDILYSGGFIQTLYFESETMESSYPTEEEGQKNGEGQFVRTFARQVKKYLARTKQMPDYMVDVFNRMKLHDNIELTDLVGDVHSLLNLEVDHEWLFDDKYYAKMDLTFDYDETVIIAACCENLTAEAGSTTIDSGDITIDQI